MWVASRFSICVLLSDQLYLQVAVPYVHDREQFGKAVGTFQLMQGKIADMYTKISATRAYVYAVGRGGLLSSQS